MAHNEDWEICSYCGEVSSGYVKNEIKN